MFIKAQSTLKVSKYSVILVRTYLKSLPIGFRSLAEGEEVEFDVMEDKTKGKKFAGNVTGPNGAFVQGAPRKERSDNFNRY